MIDESRPHNPKAVELFKEYLPNWVAPVFIEGHIKSCEQDARFKIQDPYYLKDAISDSIDWEILDGSPISCYITGNHIDITTSQLVDFYGHLLDKEDIPTDVVQEDAKAHDENLHQRFNDLNVRLNDLEEKITQATIQSGHIANNTEAALYKIRDLISRTLRKDIGNDLTKMLNEIQHAKQGEYRAIRDDFAELRSDIKFSIRREVIYWVLISLFVLDALKFLYKLF